ncbi:pectin esterase, partial [Streptomyces albiflaviniger]|nr:pectin esterase [Streptomyces albiflaviniger]
GFKNPVIKDATATLVQRGNVFVNTSGRNESGGTAFDPKASYSYSLDPADRVPSIVGSGSGPSSAIGATG